jgi:hypothetical protein
MYIFTDISRPGEKPGKDSLHDVITECKELGIISSCKLKKENVYQLYTKCQDMALWSGLNRLCVLIDPTGMKEGECW